MAGWAFTRLAPQLKNLSQQARYAVYIQVCTITLKEFPGIDRVFLVPLVAGEPPGRSKLGEESAR